MEIERCQNGSLGGGELKSCLIAVLEHVSRHGVRELVELVGAHAQQGRLPGPAATQALIGRLAAAKDIPR